MSIEYPNENKNQASPPTQPEVGNANIESQPVISHTWRNWSLIIALVVILIIAGWWYYSSQLKNYIPPVEEKNVIIDDNQKDLDNKVIEEDLFDEDRIIGYKLKTGNELNLSQSITFGNLLKSEDLFNTLSQLATPAIICIDQGKQLNIPKYGELLCNDSDTFWPELPEDFYWNSEDFSSSIDDYTYSFSVRSNIGVGTECNQSGCVFDEYYRKNEVLDIDLSTVDSDKDNLSDTDEFMIWGTDRNIKDTDEDGYTDGEEINNGYNPLGQGELYKILENQEISYEKPQLAINALALAINNLDIDLFTSSVSESFWQRKKKFISKDDLTELTNFLTDTSQVGKVFFAFLQKESMESSKGNYYYISVRIFVNGKDTTAAAKGENHILLEKVGDSWKVGDIDMVIKDF